MWEGRRPAGVATPPPTLLVASLLAIVTGAVYLAIGVHYARRAVAARVQAYFALYWLGLAFFGLSDGAWSILVPLADPPLALGVTILYLKTIFGSIGFFGLVYYLTYLYRGDERAKVPLAVFYGLAFSLVLYSYVAADPVGQEVQTWRSGLVYAHPGGAFGTIAVLLLFAPPLLAAIAYARLRSRTTDPRARRRILVTSVALGVFFGTTMLAWLASFASWWPLAEKLLALGSGIAVVRVLRD